MAWFALDQCGVGTKALNELIANLRRLSSEGSLMYWDLAAILFSASATIVFVAGVQLLVRRS